MEPTGEFGDFATGEGVSGHGSIVTHGESVRAEGASAVPCLVANEPEGPSGGTQEGSLSPAERIGSAVSDWLQDRPRRQARRRFDPVEVTIFAVIATLAFVILGGVFAALADSSEQGFTFIDSVLGATQWAQPPLVIAILGTTLLASYQSRRSCNELESFLADDDYEDDASGDSEAVADIEEFMTSLLRRLRRSRLALVCLGFLGLLSGAASITLLVVVLQRAVGFSPSPTWYSYAGIVAQTLAVAVPSLTCVVVATRGWTRGSDLLRGDDADAGFKDETEHPAATEPVS